MPLETLFTSIRPGEGGISFEVGRPLLNLIGLSLAIDCNSFLFNWANLSSAKNLILT